MEIKDLLGTLLSQLGGSNDLESVLGSLGGGALGFQEGGKVETTTDTTPDFNSFLESLGIKPETLLGRMSEQPIPSDLGSKKQTPSTGVDINSLLQESLLETGGKGRDDDIPAQIDGVEPAAISSGEYIVPASDVALLGDGNSEAGARVLERLLAKIRTLKTGTAEQPPKLEELLGLLGGE